jgi:hypothetical protein
MYMNNYVKNMRVSIKSHPEFNERWIQNLIASDPSILGLGDVVIRAQERVQPRAGRLDMLLQDRDSKQRYEVEIQLGAVDESHIIRTVEYWDIERKRYPQYDHCAVIIAEDITSRFLNVISLFNGTIPLIALQMQMIKVEDYITVLFTKVLDQMSRGLVDEDEDAAATPTDRAYWETRATAETVRLADDLLELAKEFEPNLQLKYNKFYIGLSHNGIPFNFLIFFPRKKIIDLYLRLPRTEETDTIFQRTGLEILDYDAQWQRYRVRLTASDLKERKEVIKGLIEQAFNYGRRD